MSQDDVQRSISFRELKWDDVDAFAKKQGFKDRSPFIEHCVQKTMLKRRFQNIMGVLYILMLALVTVLLIIINMKIR